MASDFPASGGTFPACQLRSKGGRQDSLGSRHVVLMTLASKLKTVKVRGHTILYSILRTFYEVSQVTRQPGSDFTLRPGDYRLMQRYAVLYELPMRSIRGAAVLQDSCRGLRTDRAPRLASCQ